MMIGESNGSIRTPSENEKKWADEMWKTVKVAQLLVRKAEERAV